MGEFNLDCLLEDALLLIDDNQIDGSRLILQNAMTNTRGSLDKLTIAAVWAYHSFVQGGSNIEGTKRILDEIESGQPNLSATTWYWLSVVYSKMNMCQNAEYAYDCAKKAGYDKLRTAG